MVWYHVTLAVFQLLLVSCSVGLVVCGLLIPLAKHKRASFAVMKRNFVGYFSNPTGYVFICVFMLLSSFAAFWPPDFFNANLATLNELNRWFPVIMLVFIPAITMSIWAEERHEATDELLLTIPASDLDIVLGKFLAAVSIYSVSLFFSMITNFLVLLSLALGDIDVGLFVGTYVGYWFVGLAMLALGMAASFLTNNLTVGFILGALFNAPLVFLVYADALFPGRNFAQQLTWWSYSARFTDFGRGVISFAAALFFVLVAMVGIYLSIILIGRRHWLGGRDGRPMLGHYLIRGVALALCALAISRFAATYDWIRFDATSGKVSSLSSDTRRLLKELNPQHTVLVQAFISESVPQAYVKTKVDLISMLREFDALAKSKVQVRIHDDLKPFSEQAKQAEEQFGITGRRVTTQSHGTIRQEELFMGAAFTCGLERVVVPFFDQGIPAEYELVRSIVTVARGDRQKIGVLRTDAELFGGFDMQRMEPRPKELIIEELEKQYEVEEVDPNAPINTGVYDVLMVVQPSSLTQPQLDNLIAAIRTGQPTAIFEDPFPVALPSAPGTSEPRRPPGGMFGMGAQPPEPKGDIRRLWDVLGVDMVGGQSDFEGQFDAEVIWQAYNPYRGKVQRHQNITEEWVFISPDQPGADDEALNVKDSVTSGLTQLLFLYPGAVRNLGARDLHFTPLAKTGDRTGTIRYTELRDNQRNPMRLQYLRNMGLSEKHYVIAARIEGRLKDDLTMSDARSPLLPLAQAGPAPPEKGEQSPDEAEERANEEAPAQGSAEKVREPQIHVVYVSDIDLLSSAFLALRAQPDPEIKWEFDNVTFVLNVLDSLAGDDALVEIRKRKMRHSTLKSVELRTDEALGRALEEKAKFDSEFRQAEDDARQRLEKAAKELEKKVEELQKKAEEEGQSKTQELISEMTRLEIQRRTAAQRLEAETERLRRDFDRRMEQIDDELEREVQKVQTGYKWRATLLPFIPPLVIGVVVWYVRNKRERESVGTTRLR
jgi:ABC-2 type transport system permease protein